MRLAGPPAHRDSLVLMPPRLVSNVSTFVLLRIIRVSESFLLFFRNDGETRQMVSGAAVAKFLKLAFQVRHRRRVCGA